VLSRLAEPGDEALAAQVAQLGPQEVLDRLAAGRLHHPRAAGWSVRLAGVDVERDLDRGARVGARWVTPEDAEWPTQVADLATLRGSDRPDHAAPLGLWVRGPLNLREVAAQAVAVVGSRAASQYGVHVAQGLGYELAAAGHTVLSGAAYGIDAAAHAGALAADGPTVAVLACGIDEVYPRGNAALVARVAASGAVVTEMAPGAAPTRLRFLRRNRLIATLSVATVVVEADLRSGALNTARLASQLLRQVGAVPGPVTSATSAGAHRLIREGQAVLVRDAADVVELVSPMGVGLRTEPSGQASLFDDLDPLARRVVEALPVRAAAHPQTIARVAGLDLPTVQTMLTRLELSGLAERGVDGWRARRVPSEPHAPRHA
jgi:DNA processing protein